MGQTPGAGGYYRRGEKKRRGRTAALGESPGGVGGGHLPSKTGYAGRANLEVAAGVPRSGVPFPAGRGRMGAGQAPWSRSRSSRDEPGAEGRSLLAGEGGGATGRPTRVPEITVSLPVFRKSRVSRPVFWKSRVRRPGPRNRRRAGSSLRAGASQRGRVGACRRGRRLGRGTAGEIRRATCSGRENSFPFPP